MIMHGGGSSWTWTCSVATGNVLMTVSFKYEMFNLYTISNKYINSIT